MNRPVFLALAALWAGCAAPRPRPAAQIPPAAAGANFELSSYEVVGTPEEDTLEYVQVFLDGRLQGRTEVAAKSRPKLWLGRISEGNHPMRFEVWDSTGGASGVRRPEDLQPRERFIRVEPGFKTSAVLRFSEQGRRSLLSITYEPRPR